MAKDLWLPNGHELEDGSEIRALLYSGDEWQIFETNGTARILLAKNNLVKQWSDAAFLSQSLFGEIIFGESSFRVLASPREYALASVQEGHSPESKVDALAFSLALRDSRELSSDPSFHDAIYVEQFTRLLPTWTFTPRVNDEVVLGTWITGGVVVSTDSFRRLASLAGWMSIVNLAEVLSTAGFKVPTELDSSTSRTMEFQPQESGDFPTANMAIGVGEGCPPDRDHSPGLFSLPGRPRLERFFQEHVVDIILNAEKYQAMGIEFPSAIVLHGPPGCGKTFAVERLVNFLDWPSFSIDSNSVGSPYIHATSKKISEVFDTALDSSPAVIIIDEMESYLSDRLSDANSGSHRVEEVAEFLRRIPEASQNKVLVIGMTNFISMIDPAILRRGRFDHKVDVGMPSREEVSSLLKSLLSKLPKSSNLNYDFILDCLTGKALSDSAFVIREAARITAKVGKSEIDQASLDAALASLPGDEGGPNRHIGFGRDKP